MWTTSVSGGPSSPVYLYSLPDAENILPAAGWLSYEQYGEAN